MIKKGRDIKVMNIAICKTCDAEMHTKPGIPKIICLHCGSSDIDISGGVIQYIEANPASNVKSMCSHCKGNYVDKKGDICSRCDLNRCPICKSLNATRNSKCIGGQSTGITCDYECSISCPDCGHKDTWISTD